MPLLHYPLSLQLCRDDLYLLRTISMIQRKNSGKPTPAMPSKTSQMVQDFCSSTMCQLLQSDLVWTYKWPFSGLKMWPPFGELTGHFKEPGGWFVKLVKPFPTSPDTTGWVFLYQWCFRAISRYHDLKKYVGRRIYRVHDSPSYSYKPPWLFNISVEGTVRWTP